MKKTFLFSFLYPLLFLNSAIAQNWVNGGNALTANGTFGTTTNFPVIFKTNNIERGRLANTGLWGFGTATPNSIVHINSAAGQVPLRVDVHGATKFLIHNNGGASIGNNITPPVNGLYVAGNTGIGTPAPENKLHVFGGSAGNVTGYFQAPLLVENSTNCYINILAPDTNETGILFGRPYYNVDGGIFYNTARNRAGLEFRTNGNIPRVFLNARGQLGIGTDPDWYKLKVLIGGPGTGDNGLALANVSGDLWELYPLEGNGVPPTIGGLALYYNTHLRGEFFKTTGDYASISDRRLKTNIKPMEPMLENIMQLKPSTYQFKNTTDKQEYNGFIAQDVMKLFPNMVSHVVDPSRKLDVYTMDYNGFGVLAIKGIQELQPIVKEQQEKMAVLEKEYATKIAMLEDRISKLEAILAPIIVYKKSKCFNSTY